MPSANLPARRSEVAALAQAAEALRRPAERMRSVCDVAARHAGAVDRDGRFPVEAVAALKSEALLGVQIPKLHGGEGLSVAEVADLCTMLGQVCGSTAMIYAMHQIKAASLISFGGGNAWLTAFTREVARKQLLLGSATTEGGIGGDLRNSLCAVEIEGERFSLAKNAIVISYGAEADAILATARRAPDAQSSDQVMVVLRRGDRTLERTTTWDTLGMRGTCSDGHVLRANGHVDQIFPKPFSEIAAQSMLASSHIFWSAVWFGIAADAIGRAQAFVRAAARRSSGVTPPGALRLAEAMVLLQQMKSTLVARIARYEAAKAGEDDLSSIGFAVEMNNLKVSSSQLAAQIVHLALMITGIAGYKNDTPFSVGRHMRDVASAAIMISNDRILSNTSTLLLMSRFDTSLAA